MKLRNIIIVVLTIILLGLLSFICYDKFIKKEEKIECIECQKCQECEKCPEAEDNSSEGNDYGFSAGKFMSITYDENRFSLVELNCHDELNQKTLCFTTKELTDMKISNAQIMSGIITNAEDECAIIVMEDGSVYWAYFGDTDEKLHFRQIDLLKNYKIATIIEGHSSSEEVVFKVLLQDGTIKTISSNS